MGKKNLPPLTVEAVKKYRLLKDIDTLTLIADRADDAQLPDVALKALEALESLNFKDKRKLTLKRAQILIKYGNSAEAVRILTPYVEKKSRG